MLNNIYANFIHNLKQQHRFRSLTGDVISINAPKNSTNSFNQLLQHNLNFASNDYLGLSNHPKLLQAAYDFAKIYGVGATGSRLLSGDRTIFLELEQQISKDKGTEAALIFNSGFQANISVLSSLLDFNVLEAKPLVFFDKLNHSSLYQAIFLSKAELIRYRHNDMQHLADLLAVNANVDRPKFIVTETLFGMDGDLLPIEDLIFLANKYQAFVYLDEAHATGIIGDRGYGLAAKVDFKGVDYLLMGTFSKAVGCSGAYIASNKVIIDYLINKAPGFMFSTAMSPVLIGAVSKAWGLIKDLAVERRLLFEQAAYLRQRLQRLGIAINNSNTHIIPIVLEQEQQVLTAKTEFMRKGILLSAIRPPAVPVGTARLRIALNSSHDYAGLGLLLDACEEIIGSTLKS